MYLNEQIPMVCLGCLENKYFPRDLIFGLSKKPTEPRGTDAMGQRWRVPGCGARCKVFYAEYKHTVTCTGYVGAGYNTYRYFTYVHVVPGT